MLLKHQTTGASLNWDGSRMLSACPCTHLWVSVHNRGVCKWSFDWEQLAPHVWAKIKNHYLCKWRTHTHACSRDTWRLCSSRKKIFPISPSSSPFPLGSLFLNLSLAPSLLLRSSSSSAKAFDLPFSFPCKCVRLQSLWRRQGWCSMQTIHRKMLFNPSSRTISNVTRADLQKLWGLDAWPLPMSSALSLNVKQRKIFHLTKWKKKKVKICPTFLISKQCLLCKHTQMHASIHIKKHKRMRLLSPTATLLNLSKYGRRYCHGNSRQKGCSPVRDDLQRELCFFCLFVFFDF